MSDLISLICPQCNAQLSLRENETSMRCPYCETEIVVKEALTARSIDRLGASVAESIDRLGSSVEKSVRTGTRDAQEEQRRLSVYNHLCLYEHCFRDHRFDDFEERGQDLMKLDNSDDFYRLKKDMERYAFLCCHPIIVTEVLIFAAKMFGISLIAGIVLLFILGPFPVLNCLPFLLPLVPVAYLLLRLKQRKDDEKAMIALYSQIEDRFSMLKDRFSPEKARPLGAAE